MRPNTGGRVNTGIRNIYAGILNRVILIIFPFITRTMIVYIIGTSYLGLSSLFNSIFTVLNLSELGFGSALVYCMYKPVADGDREKIGALLHLYKKIYNAIGAFILLGGIIIMPFVPKLIKGSWPEDINIYVLYVLFLSNTSLSYFMFAYKKSLLMAYQRNDVISHINTLVSVSTSLCQIIMLVGFKNYYAYIVIAPIFTIIENLVTAKTVNKMYPDIVFGGGISREEKQVIAQHVKGIALQKLCSATKNSFDSIIISAFCGLTAVAIYGNYYYIMFSIHALLYLIPNSIRSIVGNSVASETKEKNYTDFRRFLFSYNWLSSWAAICLFCLYQPFMDLWMGSDKMLPLVSVFLLCVYFYELSMSDIIALYKDGAGLWWQGRYRTLIEAVSNIILNIVLGKMFGINGVIFSTIITLLLLGLGYGGYIIFSHYFTIAKFSDLIRTHLMNTLIVLFVGAITYATCQMIKIDSVILCLCCRAIICILIPNILFWLIFRKSEHFLYVKQLAKYTLTRKK